MGLFHHFANKCDWKEKIQIQSKLKAILIQN